MSFSCLMHSVHHVHYDLTTCGHEETFLQNVLCQEGAEHVLLLPYVYMYTMYSMTLLPGCGHEETLLQDVLCQEGAEHVLLLLGEHMYTIYLLFDLVTQGHDETLLQDVL